MVNKNKDTKETKDKPETTPETSEKPGQLIMRRLMAAMMGSGTNGCDCEPCQILRVALGEVQADMVKELPG